MVTATPARPSKARTSRRTLVWVVGIEPAIPRAQVTKNRPLSQSLAARKSTGIA